MNTKFIHATPQEIGKSILEELTELDDAIEYQKPKMEVAENLGDLSMALANLGRIWDIGLKCTKIELDNDPSQRTLDQVMADLRYQGELLKDPMATHHDKVGFFNAMRHDIECLMTLTNSVPYNPTEVLNRTCYRFDLRLNRARQSNPRNFAELSREEQNKCWIDAKRSWDVN